MGSIRWLLVFYFCCWLCEEINYSSTVNIHFKRRWPCTILMPAQCLGGALFESAMQSMSNLSERVALLPFRIIMLAAAVLPR